MRGFARLLLTLSTLVTAVLTIWAFTQNPFAAPLVERGAASAKIALTQAMTKTVTTEWLIPRLEAALSDKDSDAVEMYLELARDADVAVPTDLADRAQSFSDTANGFLAQAGDCAVCAADIANCTRLSHIAACAIPLEFTPVGDLNALRRASVDWASGDEIDRLEVSLAFVGLGATGLAMGTAGATLPVKAGASMLRMSRNLGALTPGFTHVLLGLTDIAVSWDEVPDYLLGRVPLDKVADTKKIADLGALARDLGTVRTNTSSAEALVLLKHIDNVDDAHMLARVSVVQGPKTRHTLEALGKSKTFRALHRLSDLALFTVGLVVALFAQVFWLITGTFTRMARRPRR